MKQRTVASGLCLVSAFTVAISIASAGYRVYVSNEGSNEIAVFDEDHLFQYAMSQLPPSSPRMLQLAPNGHIYVASYGSSQIADFGPDDSYVGAFGHVTYCTALAVGADNRIYSGDFDGVNPNRIYTPSGTALGTFGGAIGALAVTSTGHLVGINNHNERTYVMDLDGEPIRDWLVGSAPRGVAVGPDDHLYIVRDNASDIQVYEEDGTLIRTITSPGLVDPYGLAFSPRDTLYVANFAAHTVVELDYNTGQLIRTIANHLSGPVDITFRVTCTDADGDSYFYEAGCGTARDCNDADPNAHPGFAEVCDGNDNDCDGGIDNSLVCDGTCDLPEKAGGDSRITDQPGGQSKPALVWTGDEYGVVWQDAREGSWQVSFARIDPQGVKLGTDVHVTTGYNGGNPEPKLTWTGSSYGVVWTRDSPSRGDIYFARLDPGGAKQGSDVRITDNPDWDEDAQIAWSGSEYGLVWHHEEQQQIGRNLSSVYFARVDRAGVILGNNLPITASMIEAYEPALVWNGSEYGVVWRDFRDGNWGIYFARLDPFGIKIGVDVRVNAPTNSGETPCVAWSGTEFGIAWMSNSEKVAFARLDASGQKIGTDSVVSEGAVFAQRPAITWTGHEYGITWFDGQRDGSFEIYFARIGPGGQQVAADLRITANPSYSWYPSIDWTGAEYGISWADNRPGTIEGDDEIYFTRVACDCIDNDGDGSSVCNDCDDSDNSVYPGAPQICDAANNDCNQSSWPGLQGTNEADDDGDAFTECAGDCEDGNSAVYPGATQICDGLNNNCVDVNYPIPAPEDRDDDGDGLSECSGDCDDARASVHPGASQVCDGFNNRCEDASWPVIPADEIDNDADAFSECQGDCDDTRGFVHPGAADLCNGIDDDCSGQVDEDALGVDSDGDGVHNACDSCRFVANPTQTDGDGDHVGNACDNCINTPNLVQTDSDSDGRGDACDNCVVVPNSFQDDTDGDRVGDACDNCSLDFDPSQTDFNHDGEGDVCDLNDGLIFVYGTDDRNYVEWQAESGYTSWNSYRGSLAVLLATGQYTQAPGSNPLAGRDCGLSDAYAFDDVVPNPGEVSFSLVTGLAGGVDSGLGTNSAGVPRANANPCP